MKHIEEPVRFEQDTDGYMTPSEHGNWIRVEDYDRDIVLLKNALLKACGDNLEYAEAYIQSQL